MKSMSQLKYYYGVQLRVYPDCRQKRMIKVNSNDSSYYYNKLVALHTELYHLKQCKFWIKQNEIRKAEIKLWLRGTYIKKGTPFLNDKYLDSLSLANAKRNYQTAWKNYRSGLQHIPTFHAKRQHPYENRYQTNCLYHKNKNGKYVGSVKILDKHHLRVPKLGKLRLAFLRNRVWNHRTRMRIGTVTIYKNPLNHYYVSLQLASDYPFVNALPKTNGIYGYDLNTSNFSYDTDRNEVPNPRYYQHKRHRLERLDRVVSRRRRHNRGRSLRSCRNYQKSRQIRAKVSRSVKNQRGNFLNNHSKKLVENQDWIFGEDLKSSNMLRNHRLVQNISDVGWREYITMLQQKSAMYGKHYVLVDSKYTTQICHHCGYNMSKHGYKLTLKDRQWTCPRCGIHHIRDYNAALNIRTRGIRKVITSFYTVLITFFRMATHGSKTVWLSYLATWLSGVTDVSKLVASDQIR